MCNVQGSLDTESARVHAAVAVELTLSAWHAPAGRLGGSSATLCGRRSGLVSAGSTATAWAEGEDKVGLVTADVGADIIGLVVGCRAG
jgi:hypothetical protein